jgi:hypothetical protein
VASEVIGVPLQPQRSGWHRINQLQGDQGSVMAWLGDDQGIEGFVVFDDQA